MTTARALVFYSSVQYNWPTKRPCLRGQSARTSLGILVHKGDHMHYRVGSVLLGLVLMGLLLAGCSSSSTPTAGNRATATSEASPTLGAPTSVPTTNPALLGWTRRGPALVDQIREAPSAPSTVYACGPAPSRGQGLGFGVSTDGGLTWQSWSTSIPSASCLGLRVSPSAPQAVAIYSASCRAECGQSDFSLDYSLDGGRHWTLVYTNQTDTGESFGWVGTDLFTQIAPPGTPASTTENLAVSKNGGPFSWTSLPYPSGLLTTATTLYAPTGAGLYTSTDLGASWRKVTPAYQGHAIDPTALTSGAPLLGYDARAENGPNIYPLYRSADGGATWQPLPSLPTGMQADTDAVEVPNGTIYETCIGNDAEQSGIYKLTPGASSWTLVSTLGQGALHLHTVTWDAGGDPVDIWGLQETDTYTNVPWTHAA
jgi:hypothetical protein